MKRFLHTNYHCDYTSTFASHLSALYIVKHYYLHLDTCRCVKLFRFCIAFSFSKRDRINTFVRFHLIHSAPQHSQFYSTQSLPYIKLYRLYYKLCHSLNYTGICHNILVCFIFRMEYNFMISLICIKAFQSVLVFNKGYDYITVRS